MSGWIGLWCLAAYLLGAIPTSYLAARFGAGIDLRQVGSRNLGATNLYRALGWRYAVPVGVFDVAKGAIPVFLFAPWAGLGNWGALGLGGAAILGHVYSVFARFKGGKGVATSAGVVLGLAPLAFLVAVLVWALVVWRTGYVSLGSLLGAAVFPAAVAMLYPERREVLWFGVGLALLIAVFHRANIGRLLQGTENRFGRRGPADADAGPAA
jgi:glycerol-3-phosphate acyltransferase PlsY